MIVTSSGIKNGTIEDKYGVRGEKFIGDMPTYSLPFKIKDAPKDTVSFALIVIDHDAILVAGFTWIHWVVANLERNELLENESVNAQDFVQGTNSWSSKLLAKPLTREVAATYGGMVPPDGPHTYLSKVYALNKLLDLKNGFYLNELFNAMEGHVLDEALIRGKYSNK